MTNPDTIHSATVKLRKRGERGWAITRRGTKKWFNDYDVLVDGEPVARIKGYLRDGGGTGWSLRSLDGKPYEFCRFYRRDEAVAAVIKRYAAE